MVEEPHQRAMRQVNKAIIDEVRLPEHEEKQYQDNLG